METMPTAKQTPCSFLSVALSTPHGLAHFPTQSRRPCSGGFLLRKWEELCYRADSQSVSSVAQSCPTLCNPMDCSTPGLPVHHQLLESTQTHVYRVGDAFQPSHLPVSLSHQEASISLLPQFIRGQTEWKPQSQKTNQSDHMDHSLVWLNETMSHAA